MVEGLISGRFFVASGSNAMLLETHVSPDLHRGNCGGQVSHAHQIVGEGKCPVHFAHPAVPNLPHERNRLEPSETFFYPLPLLLADGVTRVPRGATINRAAAASSQVLRHVRPHAQIAALLHKPERVESFVAADGQRLRAGKLFHHDQRIAFRRPVGLEYFRIHDQPVAILDQQVPAVTQLGLLPLALARQQSVRIGLRLMGFVRGAAKVHRGISGIVRRKRRLVLLRLETLQTRPRFQQRAVHGEVLIRCGPWPALALPRAPETPWPRRPPANRSRFLLNVVGSQTSSSAFSPTNQRRQQVVVHLFPSANARYGSSTAFAAQQLLRRNRRTADACVHCVEPSGELSEYLVHHRPDSAQRMILAHALFGRQITEHMILLLIVSAHAFSYP
jgi:hypothetical protein